MKSSPQDLAIKVITPTVHSVLDYAAAIFLLLSPSLFGLSGVFAFGAYALGVAHLILTISTRSPGGLFEALSFQIHGLIELLIAIGMIISPWIFVFSDMAVERNFFLLFGIVMFVIWFLTRYVSRTDSLSAGSEAVGEDSTLRSELSETEEENKKDSQNQNE